MLIGLISDTHGKLPPAVHDAFRGVDHVIHAGDIGGPDILWELNAIAPVTAVLGNNDHDLPGWDLSPHVAVTLGGLRFLVGHLERPLLAHRDLHAEEIDVVVVGHTHLPRIERRDSVLLVNPGSPTRSRGAGHTVVLLQVDAGLPSAAVVQL